MSSKKTYKKYGLSFKHQVIREYEAGLSIYQLRQKYGIGSHSTIQRWVEKYSRAGYRTETVIIQNRDDQLKVKGMKTRISELEQVVAELVLENRMLSSIIDVASTSLEMDLKKKFGKT